MTQTEVALDRADKEDSGRGLEFAWLNAELGPEYVGLQALKADKLVDGTLVDSKGFGMMYGAGVGARLLAFTLGARFRFGFLRLAAVDVGGRGGHAYSARTHRAVLYVRRRLRLARWLQKPAAVSPLSPSAKGFDLRGGVGLDVYLSNTFSIGGNLSGDLLFLSRSASAAVPLPPGSQEQQNAMAVYAEDGSGIGAGATLSLVLGLHI